MQLPLRGTRRAVRRRRLGGASSPWLARSRCRPLRLMAPLALAIAASVSSGSPAQAHGASLNHQNVQAVEAIARYESGEPMAGASVTVYPPNDPQTPWLTGTTDRAGRFWFRPDRPGPWELKVRQAGHGSLITIDVDNRLAPLPDRGKGPQTAGSAPLNRWVTIAAIAWGCVGTALFFSRRRSTS